MKGTLLHYIIGISAAILALVAIYYIYENPKNLISAGIVIFAGCFVAFSQYLIIKGKNKK
ncbi:hypothetical protein [Pedobacter punctiformis]|uniref:Uncharacterized protein n=1 Tax=Pedobacter punctiformis TaxID=3004097 RepID=A0ABT4L608_9SPHI|nr:hypothetical protein [Pedobacter sp. HCMS5-2]MCZ4243364.1 hypothetical protein [Pedobacter sp. HCMS5-2]